MPNLLKNEQKYEMGAITGLDCTVKIQNIKFMTFQEGSSRTKQVQSVICRDACVHNKSKSCGMHP